MMRFNIGHLNKGSDEGFTFIEVLAVIVLISIFTVLAIVQHARTDPTLIVQTQVLQSHIRYAQMRSMNSDVSWGINYNNGSTPEDRYYEIYAGNTGNVATIPGESDRRVNLGDMGITVKSTADASAPSTQTFQLSFDSWGQPAFNGTPASDLIRLEIEKAGHDTQYLNITPRTGFIP